MRRMLRVRVYVIEQHGMVIDLAPIVIVPYPRGALAPIEHIVRCAMLVRLAHFLRHPVEGLLYGKQHELNGAKKVPLILDGVLCDNGLMAGEHLFRHSLPAFPGLHAFLVSPQHSEALTACLSDIFPFLALS
jgi:hypothetical protein